MNSKRTTISKRATNPKRTMISKYFLKYVKIESFGFFSKKVIGPFKPQLNVVFGKNEAGKTTLNAFLLGVLFGWEEARGKKNTYKQQHAERSGSVFFGKIDGKEEIEFSRAKNIDGLQGPEEFIADIDKETFRTMFSLTGDELRSLRNTTDVTAKLLTAGSGTKSSPTEALALLQKEIQSYTSRAAGFDHSLVNIETELDELRDLIARAGDEAKRFKQQDREFHEILPQRDMIAGRIDKLNRDIEALTAGNAALEKIEANLEQALLQKEELDREGEALAVEDVARDSIPGEELRDLSTFEDAALRGKIEKLGEDHSKYELRISAAQDNYLSSKTAYETLVESENAQGAEARYKRQRQVQSVFSIVLPCLFVLVGVPVFMRGREIGSLSFTALGIGLVFSAIILAVAAFVMMFRPNKSEEALKKRKEDMRWVMLQDEKKLEACEKDLAAIDSSIREFLDEAGLAVAQGSLRQARVILDEVQHLRAKDAVVEQRKRSLTAQQHSTAEAIDQAKRQRSEVYERLELDEGTTRGAIESLIERKAQQRSALIESSESLNRRYGELKQELAQAKNLRNFDKYKLLYQEALTRQQESLRDLARYALAKHLLEAAINAWESKSQPEVYTQASRLFEKMTAGKWTQIRMTERGELEVVDAVKTTRDPLHLSLGTCQQLYLSLRIALLMTAENVGRILPIMADDILVNFDEERRWGAAEALVELSEVRQVILFTCHGDIVSLMREAAEQVNVLEL